MTYLRMPTVDHPFCYERVKEMLVSEVTVVGINIPIKVGDAVVMAENVKHWRHR